MAPVPLDAFVVDTTGGQVARQLTVELRRAGLRADRAFDGRSLKSQMKAADRSGARVALIVGPDELAAGHRVPATVAGQTGSSAPYPEPMWSEAVVVHRRWRCRCETRRISVCPTPCSGRPRKDLL